MSLKQVATPHLIPGTNIYKNKAGIEDQVKLNQFERMVTASLQADIPDGDLSTEHLKKIHKHFFKDIYDWAGKTRDVPTEKGTTVFCRPEYIKQEADRLTKVVNPEKLKKLSPKAFASELAEIVGELNVVHPFLDGNGRTIRAYAKKVCEKSGFSLDISKLKGKEWNEASIRAYSVDSKGLAAILEKNISRPRISAVERLKQQRERQAQGRGLTR